MLRERTVREAWDGSVGFAGQGVETPRVMRFARLLEIQVVTNLGEWLASQHLDARQLLVMRERLSQYRRRAEKSLADLESSL